MSCREPSILPSSLPRQRTDVKSPVTSAYVPPGPSTSDADSKRFDTAQPSNVASVVHTAMPAWLNATRNIGGSVETHTRSDPPTKALALRPSADGNSIDIVWVSTDPPMFRVAFSQACMDVCTTEVTFEG